MLLTRALTVIVAAGIVLAAAVVWRLLGRSRGRWPVAALGAYGAIGFLHAAYTGIPLPAALAADGLFHLLPRVFQATFVGAFVVLPLGWIAAVIRAGIPRFRDGAPRRAIYQAVALTTCVGLVFAAVRDDVSSASTASLSRPQRVAQMDHSLRALEAAERDTPRDRWDPGAVVAMVGADPQQLFVWVQENTDWIPYRGVLRGPVGVLMDGQGNSLDRSLLMAALLEKTGHRARLAHGQLSREQAVALLPGLIADRAADFIPSLDDDSPTVAELAAAARQYELKDAAIGRTLAEQDAALRRVADELSARVSDQTRRLLDVVPRADPIVDWKHRLDAAVDVLRDHWWVQQQSGANWVDFDLLDQEGAALTTADATFDVNQLDQDLFHDVTVRVVAEQWSPTSLTQRTAVERRLRPSDLIGTPIVLQFAPIDWQRDATPRVMSEQDVKRAVLGQQQWWAGLQVGRDVVASALLLDSGGDPDAAVKGGDFGGIASAFSRSMGVSGGDARGNQALSAVWLEYSIQRPGQPPHVVRRAVFDLVGPAARASATAPALVLNDEARLRRGLAMTMRTEILPIVCQIAPEFVAHATQQSLTGNRDLLRALASGDGTTGDLTQRLAGAAPPVTPLLALAFSRLEWSGGAGVAARVFIDRPNILTRHQFPAIADGGDAVLRDAIDIVDNTVGVELGARDAFAIRLEQGVRDTNAEALLGSAPSSGNAGNAYATSRDWLAIAPQDRAALAHVSLPGDARRRLTEDLDAGYIAVVPPAAVRAAAQAFDGWWRIDADTGTALGVGGSGWGQSLVERGQLTSLAVTFSRSFLFEYGLCQTFPQAVNSLRVINEELFGSWHPSWTKPSAKSVDPMALADANHHVCLVQAITMGFIATLPLLLMTLRFSRSGRMLAFARRARRPRPPRPCGGFGGGPTLAMVLLVNLGNCGGRPPGPTGTQRTPPGPRDTHPDPRVTQHDPNPPPMEPPPPPPQPPARPPNLDAARRNAEAARRTYDESVRNVFNAINEIGAENELAQTGRSVGPRPAGGWDPANPPPIKTGTPNPDYDAALQNQLEQAEREMERAKAAYDQAAKDLQAAESNAKGSRGRSGLGSWGPAGGAGAGGSLGGSGK